MQIFKTKEHLTLEEYSKLIFYSSTSVHSNVANRELKSLLELSKVPFLTHYRNQNRYPRNVDSLPSGHQHCMFGSMLSMTDHGREPKIQHMAPWHHHPWQNWSWQKAKNLPLISSMADIWQHWFGSPFGRAKIDNIGFVPLLEEQK